MAFTLQVLGKQCREIDERLKRSQLMSVVDARYFGRRTGESQDFLASMKIHDAVPGCEMVAFGLRMEPSWIRQSRR